jgi:NAD(P)-dependent dehydrogenase (short-subunit alcohol dehydrogenase family)
LGRRIFITGGTGYIGSRLIPLLAARGHQLLALVRRGSDHKLPEGCIPVRGEALNGASYVERVEAEAGAGHRETNADRAGGRRGSPGFPRSHSRRTCDSSVQVTFLSHRAIPRLRSIKLLDAPARVAKSADARDLKSLFRQRECGFKSHPGHQSR